MKKLYQKSEIGFAIVWIICYCISASICDNLSENIGIEKIVTLPVLAVLSVIAFIFVKNNRLLCKYGLCRPVISARRMLFYIPLVVLLTANLWNGFALNFSPAETVLYILSMFCVGFLEEIIFRGFLFNAMAGDSSKTAIIVSSVTFGIGHIINFIVDSEAELIPGLLQIVYAIAAGFMFVMIYCRTKSLIPCIVTHCLFNALSAFANEGMLTTKEQIVSSALITVISGAYAIYLAFMKQEENNK